MVIVQLGRRAGCLVTGPAKTSAESLLTRSGEARSDGADAPAPSTRRAR